MPWIIGSSAQRLDQVQALDAYGQLVNTDDLATTRITGSRPQATIQVNQSDVFLSGVQSTSFRAGRAVLEDLRLVAEPGVYLLKVVSGDVTPTFIQVCQQPEQNESAISALFQLKQG
jgi:hypothetical protein